MNKQQRRIFFCTPFFVLFIFNYVQKRPSFWRIFFKMMKGDIFIFWPPPPYEKVLFISYSLAENLHALAFSSRGCSKASQTEDKGRPWNPQWRSKSKQQLHQKIQLESGNLTLCWVVSGFVALVFNFKKTTTKKSWF